MVQRDFKEVKEVSKGGKGFVEALCLLHLLTLRPHSERTLAEGLGKWRVHWGGAAEVWRHRGEPKRALFHHLSSSFIVFSCSFHLFSHRFLACFVDVFDARRLFLFFLAIVLKDAHLAIRTLSGNKLPDGVILEVTVKTVRPMG